MAFVAAHPIISALVAGTIAHGVSSSMQAQKKQKKAAQEAEDNAKKREAEMARAEEEATEKAKKRARYMKSRETKTILTGGVDLDSASTKGKTLLGG